MTMQASPHHTCMYGIRPCRACDEARTLAESFDPTDLFGDRARERQLLRERDEARAAYTAMALERDQARHEARALAAKCDVNRLVAVLLGDTIAGVGRREVVTQLCEAIDHHEFVTT